jgi:signal-transduction protein with cAMP-binding, CBS, and nucleotidyltransferase domain
VLNLLLGELGPPPVPFACIVMGSGGRGESLLSPDQDNGFLLADYPDELHGEIDPWFVALAERFTATLHELGFPLCRGGVMATNPVWRKTLSQWRAQLAHWMRGLVPETLLNCEIFFDFRLVWGDPTLANALREHATAAAQRDHRFQMLMFGLMGAHRAGIGLFGRLQTERENNARRGEIDLKLFGTLPLVEAVRLLALMRGIAATGTPARINELESVAIISRDDADRLRAAFALLTGLQLRQQLADHRMDVPPGTFVDPRNLTGRELELVRSGLRAINDFRAGLRAELTGSLLG